MFAIVYQNIHILTELMVQRIKGSGMTLKKVIKIFGIVITVIFVFIQFIQPARTNPAVDPAVTLQTALKPSAAVSSLLHRACRDCHSNETQWPFYAYIAPVSWLVSYDVAEGRKHFNMSEWGKYTVNKKLQKLSGIYQSVNDKSMPLPKYIPLHPTADLTAAERDTLSQWAQREGEKLMGSDEE